MLNYRSRFYNDKYSRLELSFYGCVWFVAFLVPLAAEVIDVISSPHHGINTDLLHTRFRQTLPFFIIFLLNNFIFYPLLLRRRMLVSYLISIAAMLGCLWFYSAPSERFLVPPPLPTTSVANTLPFAMVPNVVDMARLTTVIIALCIILANDMIKGYVMSMRKDEVMLQIRTDHTNTELQALRYQLDPHFLMNILNSVQALIYIDSERASNAIQLLSRLMRHLLYESSGQYISLAKEIACINDLIELMKLKFPPQAKIVTNFPVVDSTAAIPPRLFTSFIENAFKYGAADNGDADIRISISIDNNSLHFVCSNRIMRHVPENPEGIGLKNSERRLNLLYGKSHRLEISNDGNTFTVDVVVPIMTRKQQTDTQQIQNNIQAK